MARRDDYMNRKKYFLTTEEKKMIGDLYDGTTERIDKIMAATWNKYPRWYIRRIANEIGLAKKMSADWSEKEVEILHECYPRMSFARLAKKLKRINGGIYRSPTAIRMKAKRECINKRSDGFTMRMAEELLGADHRKIEKWVEKGWLKDGRKGTNRTELQGGDMHHFEAKELRNFVINYPYEVDLRRVDNMSFIQLVAGMM